MKLSVDWILLCHTSIPLFNIYWKKPENLCTHTLPTNIYIPFQHNCQNLKTSMMFFSGWMDKLFCAAIGTLLIARNKGTMKPWQDMEET